MLKIKEVHAGYGRLKILRGINLSVSQGTIVALLGGNGTGKSTLLKTISGLLPVMEGSIEFDKKVITDSKPHHIVRSGLVQVTQSKEAYPAMTVEENLEMGAFIRTDDFRETMEQVYSLFPVLHEKRNQAAGELSGGQRQQVAVGRALMTRPKVLMLDEPTAGVSPIVMDELFDRIIEVAQSGIPILMVEQNARQALEIADKGYVLVQGRNAFSGTGKDLLNDPEVRKSFLGG